MRFLFIFSIGVVLCQDFITLDEIPQEHIKDNQICTNNECIPLYFKPTNEFQRVHPGQRVPKGLHITMDFTTGIKQAKFLEEVIEARTIEEKLIHVPSSDPQKPLNIQERQSLKTLFDNLKINNNTQETLEILKDISSDIDVAMSFVHQEYLDVLFNLVYKKDDVSKHTLVILGNLVSNNMAVQQEIMVLYPGLEDMLLSMIQLDNDCDFKKKVMYFLGNLSRYRGFKVKFEQLVDDVVGCKVLTTHVVDFLSDTYCNQADLSSKVGLFLEDNDVQC
jgi:hypothetical protein